MKHPIFKSVLVLGAALALMNCSEETPVATTPSGDDPIAIQPNENNGNLVVLDECWYLDAGTPMLIYPSGTVTDAKGEVIGLFVGTPDNGSIVALDGVTVIVTDVNLGALTVLSPETNTQPTPASSSATISTPASSATVQTPASSTTVESPKSSSSAKQEVVTDGKVTITGSLEQTVSQNASTSEIKFSGLSNEPSRLSWNAYFLETSYSNGTYTIKAITVPEYFEIGEVSEFFKVEGKDYEFKINVTAKGSGNGGQSTAKSSSSQKQASSSSQQQAKSSSSAAKSSSSTAQTPASSASNSGNINYSYSNTAAYEPIKYVNGGKSGSGWATRYWDCCKPHCAWPGKGGTKAHACDASGNKINDDGASSMCDGGNSGTCLSQIPMVVNDTLAYAYAAVPTADGASCGKCYALKFTGKGKYETKANHKALLGKTLVVMTSNVGSDVSQGQFDIMIPGGGVGIFNGCSRFGWGNMGAQYGGLLTECEKEAGSSGDLRAKRKECLAKKCESTFGKDAQAKEGCMFLATWYEAAGNPMHEYKEVECPSALKNKF